MEDGTMNLGLALCMALGVVISLVVSFLKKWSWAKAHPQLLTTAISVLVAFAVSYFGENSTETIGAFVVCVLQQIAAAIATHEMVVEPISHNLVNRDDNA